MSEANSHAAEDPQVKGNELIPVLGWGKSEITDFQELWSVMIGTTSDELRTLGINLLMWMFDHVPNMKPLFSNFDATSSRETLVADEKFIKHAQRVVVHLNRLIKSLDEPAFFDDFRRLARSHLGLKPQVNAVYFEDFRDNFHLLVFDITGSDKDGKPATMWYQFLNALCVIFKEEEDLWNAGAKTGKKPGGGCCALL